MAKSKNFKTLDTLPTGEELIFDCIAFDRAVIDAANAYNKANNRSSGGISHVRNEISMVLYGKPADESFTKNFQHWKKGDNGPSILSIEDIKKMEKYFGCSLLKVRPGTGSKSPISHKITKNITTEKECTKAMFSNDEKTAAREVYTIMSDLIRMHHKLLMAYYDASLPSPSLPAKDYIPENYPLYWDVVNSIQKHSLDLPKDIRDNTLGMVYNIYGGFAANANLENYKEFSISVDWDDFSSSCDSMSTSPDDIAFDWCQYTFNQTEYNYRLLDSIFESYISD